MKLDELKKNIHTNYRRPSWKTGMLMYWSDGYGGFVYYDYDNLERIKGDITKNDLNSNDFYECDINGTTIKKIKKKELKMNEIALKYSDEDIGKVFAKKSWGTNKKGTSGTMFTWNPEEKLYGYCNIRGGIIQMKEPTSHRNIVAGKTFSQVGQGVLDAELVEIIYDKLANSGTSEREILNNIQKGKTMPTVKQAKQNEAARILIDALCIEHAEEVIEKTDLEDRSKFSMEVYGLEEEYITTLQLSSKKDAYAFLQHPQNLGKTIVIKKEVEVLTTNIPVINVTK